MNAFLITSSQRVVDGLRLKISNLQRNMLSGERFFPSYLRTFQPFNLQLRDAPNGIFHIIHGVYFTCPSWKQPRDIRWMKGGPFKYNQQGDRTDSGQLDRANPKAKPVCSPCKKEMLAQRPR